MITFPRDRLAVALLGALTVGSAGCGAAQGFVPAHPLDVRIDVWNRTLDPIFLLDPLGNRVDVPACGHASANAFRVNSYQVFSDRGLYVASGEDSAGIVSTTRRFIVVAPPLDPIQYVPAADALPSLPPCEGHPSVAGSPT